MGRGTDIASGQPVLIYAKPDNSSYDVVRQDGAELAAGSLVKAQLFNNDYDKKVTQEGLYQVSNSGLTHIDAHPVANVKVSKEYGGYIGALPQRNTDSSMPGP